MKGIGRIIVITLILLCGSTCAACSSRESLSNTINVDVAVDVGEIGKGATGFLYGIAEDGVPSAELLRGLSCAVLATKTVDGTQHPFGEVTDVAPTFFACGGGDVFVYMQDIYPDWYYAYRADYDTAITQQVTALSATEYADRIIYCPYNEMNNGVWYGDFAVTENRYAFYDAWRTTYRIIRDIQPTAVIAGPGHSDYYAPFIREFLVYCVENNCLPDVMVWHELYWFSPWSYPEHYAEYRAMEAELSVSPRRIIISEYGSMKDNGVPSGMLRYISAFEVTDSEGCIAFWRLGDNLCELAADGNTPTAAWWVYHWYGAMCGPSFSVTRNTATDGNLCAIATGDTLAREITILTGGVDGDTALSLANIDSFFDTEYLTYEVSGVDYAGLGGECIRPYDMARGAVRVQDGMTAIVLRDTDRQSVYRVVIRESEDKPKRKLKARYHDYIEDKYTIFAENGLTPIARAQAEESILHGNARVIPSSDVTYATRDDVVELSGGSSLTMTLYAPISGKYRIDTVYMNDCTSEGKRASQHASLDINGIIEEAVFANTLKSTASSKYTVYATLKKGENTVTLSLANATVGKLHIDCITAEYVGEDKPTYSAAGNVAGDDQSYVLCVPASGMYAVCGDSLYAVNGVTVDGTRAVYLMRGVNILRAEGGHITAESADIDSTIPTQLQRSAQGYDITAHLTSGEYAITIRYAFDGERGKHAYNTELLVGYLQLYTDDMLYGEYHFRNTYSQDTICERTIYITIDSDVSCLRLVNSNSETLPTVDSITLSRVVALS